MEELKDALATTYPALRRNKEKSCAPTSEPERPLCQQCNDIGFIKFDVPVTDPNFGKFQPCQNPAHATGRRRRLTELSGLKTHEREYTLDGIAHLTSITAEMVGVVSDFLAEPKGWLYIWGGPGNGKSLALMAAVNAFVEQLRPALYITFGDLLDLMRSACAPKPMRKAGMEEEQFSSAWHQWSSYQERFQRVQSVEMLAIDEFDEAKVSMTDFAHQFRARLLDHRYRDAVGEKTVTLFAGNDNPSMLPNWIWDRVRDDRFTVWQNTAASVRPMMEW